MTAVITKDGQLSLPPEVLQELGLAPGQTLEVQTEGSLLLAWKPTANDPFEKWRGRGRLPVGRTADDYLRLARDEDSR